MKDIVTIQFNKFNNKEMTSRELALELSRNPAFALIVKKSMDKLCEGINKFLKDNKYDTDVTHELLWEIEN